MQAIFTFHDHIFHHNKGGVAIIKMLSMIYISIIIFIQLLWLNSLFRSFLLNVHHKQQSCTFINDIILTYCYTNRFMIFFFRLQTRKRRRKAYTHTFFMHTFYITFLCSPGSVCLTQLAVEAEACETHFQYWSWDKLHLHNMLLQPALATKQSSKLCKIPIYKVLSSSMF